MSTFKPSEPLMAEYEVDIEPVVGRKQITIPLPRKESTWANVNPKAPCLEEENVQSNEVKKSTTDEKITSEIQENSGNKIEPEKTRKRTRNSEEPKRKYTRRTTSTTKKPEVEETETAEEDDEDSDESEPTFDLDKIIDHREVKKKRKLVVEYLVRWLGYDESADTWEPEENILGDFAKEQIRLYWEKKNAEATASESAPAAPIEQEKVPKKRGRKSAEEKARLKQQEAAAEEVKEKSHPILSDFSSSGGSLAGNNDETNHTWFGIKEEDAKSKHAKREFKNLYVSDRKLSLSEKLLAEVGTSSTGRVTRSSLKPLKEDVEPDSARQSKTPEPTFKRRRQTESPAQSNRYSPEPPMAKRTRKSMPVPAQKTTVEKKEVQKPASPPAPIKEPPKRASDSAEPPSKLMPKIAKAPPPPARSTSPAAPKPPLPPQLPKLTHATPPPTKTSSPPSLKPEVLPVLEPIIDPRAKKPETKEVEKTPESQPEVEPAAVVAENGGDDESNYLTNKDFEYMKEMEIPNLNVEMFMENVWDATSEPGKVVNTYDEFVRAVIEGDGKTVYSTFKAKCSYNLNERDAEGRTLLHHIAIKQCDDKHSYDLIAKLLVLQGAELTIVDSKFGKTALHAAVCANHPCMVQTLIDLASPINTVDHRKHTPLLSAILSNNFKIVSTLLRAGVNIHNIHMIMEKDQVSEKIKDLIFNHKESIIKSMDEARNCVLPQAENVKGTVDSSLFVAPIAESGVVEYTFDVNLDDNVQKPGTYFIFEFALMKLGIADGKVMCRMWQQSPVRKITINGKEPINLHKTTNFVSMPQLKIKRNVVKIEFMNQTYQNTKFVLASRVCHVSMSGFNRLKRTEPNLKSLLPLGANPSTISPAMKILSTSLKPRFYRFPNPPIPRPQNQIRKPLPPTVNSNSVEKNDSNSNVKVSSANSTPEVRPGPVGNHHTSSGSSTSSSPLPGFVPLRKVINPYPAGGLISRPMVTPLTAANNRLAVKQTQSTPTTTTTPTSETFPPSN